MTLREWLLSPLYRDRPRPLAVERVAELVAVNGFRFRVTAWGYTSGGGLYGRTGLEQGEAIELIELYGVVNGMCLAGGGSIDEAAPLLEAEWGRVRHLRESQMAGPITPPEEEQP